MARDAVAGRRLGGDDIAGRDRRRVLLALYCVEVQVRKGRLRLGPVDHAAGEVGRDHLGPRALGDDHVHEVAVKDALTADRVPAHEVTRSHRLGEVPEEVTDQVRRTYRGPRGRFGQPNRELREHCRLAPARDHHGHDRAGLQAGAAVRILENYCAGGDRGAVLLGGQLGEKPHVLNRSPGRKDREAYDPWDGFAMQDHRVRLWQYVARV